MGGGGGVAAAIIDDHAVRFETGMMNALRNVFAFDDRVSVCEGSFSFLRVAVFGCFLEIVFFGEDSWRVGSNGGGCMDHVRQHFVIDFDRAQCVARDFGRGRRDRRHRRPGETHFSQRRRDDPWT